MITCDSSYYVNEARRAPLRTPGRQLKPPGKNPRLWSQRWRYHKYQQVEWCASTDYNGTCNVVPMTSTPMQRLRGSDGLWTTYIGVGGLSVPPGTNVLLGLRLRSSTEQHSTWCWSAETMIGKATGLVIRGLICCGLCCRDTVFRTEDVA